MSSAWTAESIKSSTNGDRVTGVAAGGPVDGRTLETGWDEVSSATYKPITSIAHPLKVLAAQRV